MTAYDCDLSSGVCPVCGLPGNPKALRNCPSKPLPKQNPSVNSTELSQPSLAQKAANFVTAAAKHIAAGAPMASEEEVARRFAICQGCEFYDGKACSKCGCPVNREKAYLSKLSWADQSCPVGKWGPAENG